VKCLIKCLDSGQQPDEISNEISDMNTP